MIIKDEKEARDLYDEYFGSGKMETMVRLYLSLGGPSNNPPINKIIFDSLYPPQDKFKGLEFWL